MAMRLEFSSLTQPYAVTPFVVLFQAVLSTITVSISGSAAIKVLAVLTAKL